MIPRTPEATGGHPVAEWAIRSRHVITPDGERPAAVLVRGERIAAVVPPDQVPSGWPVEDVGERTLMPGLVDPHVHINEPGRTDWEGFATATRAAAAGGITTVVDMPLNSTPVTTTPAALAQKLAAAEGQLWVDCGFYGGVVPGNADQIRPLLDAGVLGIKAFLCPSGIDDFPNVTADDLRAAVAVLADTDRPLLVHAELISPLAPEVEADFAANPRSYAAYLASRPPEWEDRAIQLLLELRRHFTFRLHIVHLSSAETLHRLAKIAEPERFRLTVETCPHYLVFAAEEIPDGDPRFKCAPPIRGRANRERLWEGLRDLRINMIASDHSPAPPELKHLDTGDLRRAWGGIASLQLTLPVIATALGGRWPGTGLAPLVTWMSEEPAEMLGLDDCKGALAAGFDADLVVVDMDTQFTVTPDLLQHRHPVTPYEGRTLHGRVEKTYLRGRLVYNAGRFAAAPAGRPILRPLGQYQKNGD